MSLVSSLYTGQTGLEASSTDLSVIGDNIANSNTVGFKASRADFSNAMAQQMLGSGGAVSQIGLGAELMSVQKILTQGALNNTGVATDLALDGTGFFVVKGSHNGRQGQFYTRAGQMTMDKTGYLVNQEGLRVQGYTADPTGVVSPSPGDLKLGDSASPAFATTSVNIKANLDANSATFPAAPAFDPANPGTSSNFATSVTVYDSLGLQHQVDVYFRKTGTPATGATWEYHALTDGGGTTGGTAGTAVEIQTGTFSFDLTGKLATVGTPTGTFNPLNAVQAQTVAINLGDSTGGTPPGTGLLGITQFAAPNSTTAVAQNGYGSGTLSSISIDKEGKVNGAFSNGQSRVIGQLAVALVTAADQMERAGGNLFAETTGSGNATLGKAGSGGRGGIVAGALENSNVDLSNEFIRMITAQRNYQANAKTISTADQLLAELMNLKR
jgi:flagellar hook protein FlgE